MKKHHSAIIIGGGPAGSSAAFTLASHGVDVCLIDKAVFPRDKLCGGLLTLRSQKSFTRIFDESWDSIIERRAHGVKFYYKHSLLNSVENYSELFFTRRVKFDDFLLNLAKQKGSVVYQGKTLAAIDLINKTCHLRSGEEITYDYLIGADGVNSVVAKSIFGQSFNKKNIAFALELEVDKTQGIRLVTVPEIYFGIARWGYGWVFPKAHTLTVGIGGLYTHNPDLKENFNTFLNSLFGKVPEGNIKGHYIPFGAYRKTPGLNDVLLAGDAAGLVEPITGEGIAFAMESGYFAALAIVETLNSKQPIKLMQRYMGKYTEITHALDHANKLRYFIFPKLTQNLFVKVLPNTRRLPLKHLDLMADNLHYNEYVRYLVTQILKGVAKRIFFLK